MNERFRTRRRRAAGRRNPYGDQIETANEFDQFGTLPYPVYRSEDERMHWSKPKLRYSQDWQVPGPFVGVGPSNYTRRDDLIAEDINQRLMFHGNLDAGHIDVNVDEGEVTLSGSVPDRRSKRLAEDIADSVLGVVDVHNELQIKNKQPQQG